MDVTILTKSDGMDSRKITVREGKDKKGQVLAEGRESGVGSVRESLYAQAAAKLGCKVSDLKIWYPVGKDFVPDHTQL